MEDLSEKKDRASKKGHSRFLAVEEKRVGSLVPINNIAEPAVAEDRAGPALVPRGT
jgi:hypothetical protein